MEFILYLTISALISAAVLYLIPLSLSLGVKGIFFLCSLVMAFFFFIVRTYVTDWQSILFIFALILGVCYVAAKKNLGIFNDSRGGEEFIPAISAATHSGTVENDASGIASRTELDIDNQEIHTYEEDILAKKPERDPDYHQPEEGFSWDEAFSTDENEPDQLQNDDPVDSIEDRKYSAEEQEWLEELLSEQTNVASEEKGSAAEEELSSETNWLEEMFSEENSESAKTNFQGTSENVSPEEAAFLLEDQDDERIDAQLYEEILAEDHTSSYEPAVDVTPEIEGDSLTERTEMSQHVMELLMDELDRAKHRSVSEYENLLIYMADHCPTVKEYFIFTERLKAYYDQSGLHHEARLLIERASSKLKSYPILIEQLKTTNGERMTRQEYEKKY